MKTYILFFFLLVSSVLCTGQLITRAEYFIGEDPGFGLATPIEILTPGDELSLEFTADIQTLSEGFQFINIRVKDELGKWGLPAQRVFYLFKSQSSADTEITGVEYFIDTDPGFGNGTAVSLPSVGNDLTVSFNVNVAALDDGEHILYIRSKDVLNRWGHMYYQAFTSLYTSVGEIKIESIFKLYPNPGNGEFYLEFSEEQDYPVRISITDVGGKRVYESEYRNRTGFLNLNLPAGFYFLTIKSAEKNFSQKIIIN